MKKSLESIGHQTGTFLKEQSRDGFDMYAKIFSTIETGASRFAHNFVDGTKRGLEFDGQVLSDFIHKGGAHRVAEHTSPIAPAAEALISKADLGSLVSSFGASHTEPCVARR